MVENYDVILATYNGESYLIEQLKSIERQTLPPSHIYIGDDGSTDRTISIISEWIKSSSVNSTFIPSLKRPLGCLRNFERLLSISTATYVMLSDQDDIWHPHKAINLLRSIRTLEYQYGCNIPLLAYSDMQVVDSIENIVSPSYFNFQHINPYNNHWLKIALQNVVSGCACLINRKCIDLALPFPDEIVMHDWWLALVASKSGKVIYYPETTISYRQHQNNLVGAKSFSTLLLRRLASFSDHTFIDKHIGRPIYQLQALANRFTVDQLSLNNSIRDLSSSGLVTRLLAALRLRLRKHGIIRTMLFYLLLLFWNPNDQS